MQKLIFFRSYIRARSMLIAVSLSCLARFLFFAGNYHSEIPPLEKVVFRGALNQ